MVGFFIRTYIRVDNEKATKGDSSLFNKNSVISGNGLREVSGQRILQASQAALLARGVDPGQVGEMRIGGNSDHLKRIVFFNRN